MKHIHTSYMYHFTLICKMNLTTSSTLTQKHKDMPFLLHHIGNNVTLKLGSSMSFLLIHIGNTATLKTHAL
ncbi:hypothetical protein PRUPE_7G149500 [Prunus persica]|uniref:Uncharacterized protein n=1 Tax=Prunus persica TaxID=3760 RepID=A0A251NBN0_PRUPE|nr:hypothetical protein PRUPE_7G149500 [Prunus persica]